MKDQVRRLNLAEASAVTKTAVASVVVRIAAVLAVAKTVGALAEEMIVVVIEVIARPATKAAAAAHLVVHAMLRLDQVPAHARMLEFLMR